MTAAATGSAHARCHAPERRRGGAVTSVGGALVSGGAARVVVVAVAVVDSAGLSRRSVAKNPYSSRGIP